MADLGNCELRRQPSVFSISGYVIRDKTGIIGVYKFLQIRNTLYDFRNNLCDFIFLSFFFRNASSLESISSSSYFSFSIMLSISLCNFPCLLIAVVIFSWYFSCLSSWYRNLCEIETWSAVYWQVSKGYCSVGLLLFEVFHMFYTKA